jgi:hypothetical protein
MVQNWKPSKTERLQFLEAVEKFIRENSHVTLFESEYTAVLNTLDSVVQKAESRRFRNPETVPEPPTPKIDLKWIVTEASALGLNEELELEVSDIGDVSPIEFDKFIQRLRGSLYSSRPTTMFAWSIVKTEKSLIITKRSKGI